MEKKRGEGKKPGQGLSALKRVAGPPPTNYGQKTVGSKTKDQNHKRAALECDNGGEASTNRVRKHCDKIKLTFSCRKAKFDRVSQSLNISLELLSPKIKVDTLAETCTSSMSPGSRDDLANSIHENL